MKKAIKVIAREIGQGLVTDMAARESADQPATQDIAALLVQQLAGQVVRQIEATTLASVEALEVRLRAVEGVIERLNAQGDEQEEKKGQEDEGDSGDDDDDDDEVSGTGSSLPNLKYAKPKYKDVESVLRYVESDDSKSGVKLVIMNFND